MPRDFLLILPTYSHFDYARLCVDSFVRTTPANTYQIAVIDDGSPEWWAVDFDKWPNCEKIHEHYITNDGLTRSWNRGLTIARDMGFKYAICGNSDLLFTEDWHAPIKDALETYDLVGPITNTPGHAAAWQDLRKYCTFKNSDDPAYLDSIARLLRGFYCKSALPCQFVNGFCMMAKTETWWKGAFDTTHVFDPKYKLTGNEDELQVRWRTKGMKIGFLPNSFVFHYRSVSRPEALRLPTSRGALRHESTGRNDRVHPEEHSELVDEVVVSG